MIAQNKITIQSAKRIAKNYTNLAKLNISKNDIGDELFNCIPG